MTTTETRDELHRLFIELLKYPALALPMAKLLSRSLELYAERYTGKVEVHFGDGRPSDLDVLRKEREKLK